MNKVLEFVKFTGSWVLKIIPVLFALMGMFVLGGLDYKAIKHFVGTWPPQTFLNGAELFCFIPFLTVGTLFYIGMFYAAISGQLSKEDNDRTQNP